MRKLTAEQLAKMDNWMQKNARPYDRAKWNYLVHGANKDSIIDEMLKYQNTDGGMGNGFEPDVLLPLSAAIPTAEAIFQAYEYDLDCHTPWFQAILAYFENSVQDIPKYWEDSPPEAMNYPHAPWWNYAPCTEFSPNPCAVVASAMIRYGTPSQQELGYKIAADCLHLLLTHDFCGDHDTLNMLALVDTLSAMRSRLITNEVLDALKRRIWDNTCFDSARWQEYTFQPLDYAPSPHSFGYDVVKQEIDENIDYWLNHIHPCGVWEPNFSWGIDSDISRQVTQNWMGYITVKRIKILMQFGRLEGQD